MSSNAIEAAMAQAVTDTQAECEKIWASKIPQKAKDQKIAALSSPDAVRARMLAARRGVLDEMRRAENARSTVPAVERLRKQSGAKRRKK